MTDPIGWLTRAVLDLPPTERRIVELVYYGHHTQQQVGDIVGLPVREVSGILMGAMRAIAQALEGPIASLSMVS